MLPRKIFLNHTLFRILYKKTSRNIDTDGIMFAMATLMCLSAGIVAIGGLAIYFASSQLRKLTTHSKIVKNAEEDNIHKNQRAQVPE